MSRTIHQELDRGPAAVDSPVRAPRIATLAGDSGPDSPATQTEKEGVAP